MDFSNSIAIRSLLNMYSTAAVHNAKVWKIVKNTISYGIFVPIDDLKIVEGAHVMLDNKISLTVYKAWIVLVDD